MDTESLEYNIAISRTNPGASSSESVEFFLKRPDSEIPSYLKVAVREKLDEIEKNSTNVKTHAKDPTKGKAIANEFTINLPFNKKLTISDR